MYIFIYIIGIVIWAVVWGVATNAVITNKGYDENWFWWGFFFGFIAFIVALTKPDQHYYQAREPEPQNRYGDNVSNNRISLTNNQLRPAGTWKCANCGTINQMVIGTCRCGVTKAESKQLDLEHQKQTKELQMYYHALDEEVAETNTPKPVILEDRDDGYMTSAEQSVEQKEKDPEQVIIERIKGYKELLDMGAISQEEFDKKKQELLNPSH